MHNNELVSILIPVLNNEKTIKRCIMSCINQTYENIEILVAFDVNTFDNSLAYISIFQQKENKIRIINVSYNDVSASRNALIENAMGEYVMFVDADDAIKIDAVEKSFKAIDENDADMVAFGYTTYLSNDKKQKVNPFEKYISRNKSNLIDTYLAQRLFVDEARGNTQAWGKLIKKSVFNGLSFPAGQIYEDIYLMPHIIENTKRIVLLPDCYYEYHLREDSITLNKNDLEKQLEIINSREHTISYLSMHYPDLSDLAINNLLENCFYLLGKCYENGFENNESVVCLIDEKITYYEKMVKNKRASIKNALLVYHISKEKAAKICAKKLSK